MFELGVYVYAVLCDVFGLETGRRSNENYKEQSSFFQKSSKFFETVLIL